MCVMRSGHARRCHSRAQGAWSSLTHGCAVCFSTGAHWARLRNSCPLPPAHPRAYRSAARGDRLRKLCDRQKRARRTAEGSGFARLSITCMPALALASPPPPRPPPHSLHTGTRRAVSAGSACSAASCAAARARVPRQLGWCFAGALKFYARALVRGARSRPSHAPQAHVSCIGGSGGRAAYCCVPPTQRWGVCVGVACSALRASPLWACHTRGHAHSHRAHSRGLRQHARYGV